MVPRLYGLGAGAILSLFLAPIPAWANTLRCEEFVVDDHKFNFGELRGPHTVVTSEFGPPSSYSNTTYTIDICGALKRKDDVDKDKACPKGARVCAIKHAWDPSKDNNQPGEVQKVIPIAGDLNGGDDFEWEATRIKPSESADNPSKGGVQVILKGGKYEGRVQRAVVEFRCNESLKGTEDEFDSEDKYILGKYVRSTRLARRDDGDKKEQEGWAEKQLIKGNPALIWNGYDREDDIDTLKLTWHTKYACEKAVDDEKPGSESKHWGFFTWLFFLAFIAIAAYLIFGSWLNYNRYGARGWDLLPHGDTLRDIPYLFKDWTRRVLNTVQSSGSRGGYSAV